MTSVASTAKNWRQCWLIRWSLYPITHPQTGSIGYALREWFLEVVIVVV